MSNQLRFTVSSEHADKTVLAFLRQNFPGESWSKLRQKIERSLVLVNEVTCIHEARRVETGDVISVGDKPAKTPQPHDVRIAYLDPHIVVAEKPSGMMSCRRIEEQNWSAEKKQKQPTFDESVSEVLIRRIADGERRRRHQIRLPPLRMMHRQDRDTSGLLVIARTEEAETALVQQFRRHSVHRVYWAIVLGSPVEETIRSHIVRDRGDGRRGSSNNPKIGQLAITHVRPLERLGQYSLIECQLETGRTNQIRIHLSERGHLVCGDPKYHQPFAAAKIEDHSHAPRLALHAAELGFVHPISGEEMSFQMPFPPDLDLFYQSLKSDKRLFSRGKNV